MDLADVPGRRSLRPRRGGRAPTGSGAARAPRGPGRVDRADARRRRDRVAARGIVGHAGSARDRPCRLRRSRPRSVSSVDLLRRVTLAAGLTLDAGDYRDSDVETFGLFASGAGSVRRRGDAAVHPGGGLVDGPGRRRRDSLCSSSTSRARSCRRAATDCRSPRPSELGRRGARRRPVAHGRPLPAAHAGRDQPAAHRERLVRGARAVPSGGRVRRPGGLHAVRAGRRLRRARGVRGDVRGARRTTSSRHAADAW